VSEEVNAIRFGSWTFDPVDGSLTYRDDPPQRPRALELRVLRALLTKPLGKAVSLETLETEAWYGDDVELEAIQQGVSRVRKLVKRDPAVVIERVPTGYRLFITATEASARPSPGDRREPDDRVGEPDAPTLRIFEGRGDEFALLDRAWKSPRTRVVVIAAVGGAGKSTLVARWKSEALSREDREGARRHFEWSFYNQGTNDRASSDEFFNAALRVFGDDASAKENASPWAKGARLAALVAAIPTLLVLDGVEPLQGPPDHMGEATLRDPALAALLGGLASNNPGLCVVTSRAKIRDASGWPAGAVLQHELGPLSDASGAAVLRSYGVKGSDQDLELASRAVKGHALTLSLMGSYFRVAFADDPNIARRHTFGFKSADDEIQGGHAFRVIAAYEALLEKSERRVELSILRLLGLFERPATPDCVAALKDAAIPELSDTLKDVPERTWSAALHYLGKLGLVETVPWKRSRVRGYGEAFARRVMAAGARNEEVALGEPEESDDVPELLASGPALDTHPLVREYFARRIDGPAAVLAHGRLCDHLCATVPFWPDGREGLYVLYDAIAHGCRAGRHQEVYEHVFDHRIQRGIEGPHAYYSRTKLALLDMDLVALKSFFVEPWSKLVPTLDGATQARVLAETGFRLRTLNRLREAQSMLKEGMRIAEEQKDWGRLAQYSCTLSEVHLLVGEVPIAVTAAAMAVRYADRSGSQRLRVVRRATYGDALHQHGRTDDSKRLFAEAETIAPPVLVDERFLDGLRSAQYCDVLLGPVERAAWRVFMWRDAAERGVRVPRPEGTGVAAFRSVLQAVELRATRTLASAVQNKALLDGALDELTLGRAELYAAVLADNVPGSMLARARRHLETCKEGLLEADRRDYQPAVFASIAWLRVLSGGPSDADEPLRQAMTLAEQGGMLLHQADVLLHRARLQRDPDALHRARALVERCGYFRRTPELDDAADAAKAW
jgi:DNA-binding winged helix-turn-helix (wHTH) protein